MEAFERARQAMFMPIMEAMAKATRDPTMKAERVRALAAVAIRDRTTARETVVFFERAAQFYDQAAKDSRAVVALLEKLAATPDDPLA